MFKLFVMMLSFILPVGVGSAGVNHSLLKENADSVARKIWAKESFSRDYVISQLNFYDKNNPLDRQHPLYKLPETPPHLIFNATFMRFAETCKEIYDSNDDYKPAVSLFFECVLSIVSLWVQKMEKISTLKEHTTTNDN